LDAAQPEDIERGFFFDIGCKDDDRRAFAEREETRAFADTGGEWCVIEGYICAGAGPMIE